jgi:hypothetical protein
VGDSGAKLCLDIIANDWDVLLLEPAGPDRIAGDENGYVVDEGNFNRISAPDSLSTSTTSISAGSC